MKKIELQILCSLCLLLPSLICNAMSPEVKGLKFDFLKCLDLYHSKELDRLGRDVISEPWRKASHGY